MPNFLTNNLEQPAMVVVSKHNAMTALKPQSNTDVNQTMPKRLMLTAVMIVASVLFVGHLQAADSVNLYEKNYKAQNQNNLKSLSPNPDTKMFVSNHNDVDNITMMEDGYDMMGTSGFEAGHVSADLALIHGKKIKADTVLVYSKYSSAKTPDSKMQLIKEAMKNKGEVTEKDLAAEEEKYNYYASYWAKLPPPVMGVHVIKLVQVTNDGSKPEPGLKSIAVIKESPAAKAGMLKGDVILKLGDVKMDKSDDLFAAVKRYAGQTVPVEFERNGEVIATTIALNARK